MHTHTHTVPGSGKVSSSPEINDAPHVSPEPSSCAGVGLVLADQDGVWHWQEAHQGAVLQEPQDLALIGQAPADTSNSRPGNT